MSSGWILLGFSLAVQKLCLLCLCSSFATPEISKYSFTDRNTALTFLSLLPSLLPSLASFSPPTLCYLLLPLPPRRSCWIGGVNTGRERALFHHSRAEAGRSCRAPAPGSKVYCGFHFTFPQPITAPRCSAWTLTPAKNFSQKMVWRQFHPLPSLIFPCYSFSFLSTGQFHVLTETR